MLSNSSTLLCAPPTASHPKTVISVALIVRSSSSCLRKWLALNCYLTNLSLHVTTFTPERFQHSSSLFVPVEISAFATWMQARLSHSQLSQFLPLGSVHDASSVVHFRYSPQFRLASLTGFRLLSSNLLDALSNSLRRDKLPHHA